MKTCSIVLKKGLYHTRNLKKKLKKIIDREGIEAFNLPWRLRSLHYYNVLTILRDEYSYTYKITFMDQRFNDDEPRYQRDILNTVMVGDTLVADEGLLLADDDPKLWLIDHCNVLITNHFLWGRHGYEAMRLKSKGSIRFYWISRYKVRMSRKEKKLNKTEGHLYRL